MRIGIYIDGFNLYYGARGLLGRGKSGWRWLDLRALGERLIAKHSPWTITRTRVIYCTARIRADATVPMLPAPANSTSTCERSRPLAPPM